MSEATKRNLRPESLTLIQLDDLETAVISNSPIQREHLLAAIRMARTQRGQTTPTEVERTSEAAGLAEEIEGHCQQRNSAGLGLLGRSSMGGRELTIDEQNMVVAALRAFVPSPRAT